MKTVHRVSVEFGSGPLKLRTTVTVDTAGARDSVITWARENGHSPSWQSGTIEQVLTADQAIQAIQEEIAVSKHAMGDE